MKITIKETRFDKALIDFINKHLNLIFLIVVTVIAIVARNHFRIFLSNDMKGYFNPWLDYLKSHGGFSGIATLQTAKKADYTVINQYIMAFLSYLPGATVSKMKIVSWIFDIFAATFVALFVAKLSNRPKFSAIPILAYTATLFAPTIFANSALWGQCDIIYASLILVSLYLLTSGHYGWAFVLYGLALSFKLQAVFILPLYIVLYFKTRKFSFLHFLYIPAVYLIVYLPALVFGKPFGEIFMAYQLQFGFSQSMAQNLPNFSILLPNAYEMFATPSILLTFVFIGCIAYAVLSRKMMLLKNSDLIELGMIFVICCVYFLPAMHDRYLFLADLLAVVYLFIKPNRFYIPVLIWFSSLVTYLSYLFVIKPVADYRIVSFILLGVLLFLIYDFFKPLEKSYPGIKKH